MRLPPDHTSLPPKDNTAAKNRVEDKIMHDEYGADSAHAAAGVDIRVRVSGGGQVSQIYAVRQAIGKSIVRHPHPPTFSTLKDCER